MKNNILTYLSMLTIALATSVVRADDKDSGAPPAPEAPAAPKAPTEAPAKVTAKKPALPVAKATPSESEAKGLRPLSVIVQLIDESTIIRGALSDTTSVEFKTSFGQATLPLSEVAGIRMADDATPTTTAVMHNGDSVTGASDIQRITVETEWGVANINGSNVSSILFVPGLKWTSQSGLNGTRWGLVAANATDAKKPASTPATTASNTTRASSTTSQPAGVRSSGQAIYAEPAQYGQPVIYSTP